MNTLIVIFLCIIAVIHAAPITENNNAVKFLQKYGYVEGKTNFRRGSVRDEKKMIKAIKTFQKFSGLVPTGELDSETVTLMKKPRCGVPDVDLSETRRRKKRFTLAGSKWREDRLTYSISKYPSRYYRKNDRVKIDDLIKRAFDVWKEATNITFINRRRGRVDIDLRFEEGEHGCSNSFDGQNNSLAHAFYPELGGDAHFDDDEIWTIDGQIGYEGHDMFQVILHELGHTLGLDHSQNTEALMTPTYQYHKRVTGLNEDDLKAIKKLYDDS